MSTAANTTITTTTTTTSRRRNARQECETVAPPQKRVCRTNDNFTTAPKSSSTCAIIGSVDALLHGQGCADVWGRIAKWLPFHDVMALAATNTFFYRDVLQHIEILWIYDPNDLRVVLAKRFAHGAVQEIHVLSLLQRTTSCSHARYDHQDAQTHEGIYNRHTAMALPSFLTCFNQKTLLRVFVGAHLMTVQHNGNSYPYMLWNGHGWKDNWSVGVQEKEKNGGGARHDQFGVFPIKTLTFSSSAYALHRQMILSLFGAIQSGALSRPIEWKGLCEGWRCAKIVCSCKDLLHTMPMNLLQEQQQQRQESGGFRVYLSKDKVRLIHQMRLFKGNIFPRMTCECIDGGERQLVLDTTFVKLLVTDSKQILSATTAADSMVSADLVKEVVNFLRNNKLKVRSKLTVRNYLQLLENGWPLSQADLVLVKKKKKKLTTTTAKKHSDYDSYCSFLESLLNKIMWSLPDDESFCRLQDMEQVDLQDYADCRLLWVPSKPPMRKRKGDEK